MLTISHTKTTIGKPAPKSFLATMEIFQKLPPLVLQEIEKRMVEKHYAKHDSIFLDGDPAESVWFVKEGYVKGVNNAANGRCQTLCMVGPRGMFGTCCCFGGGEYPCHSIAETDVTVVSMLMRDFMVLLGKYPEISAALVTHISQRLRYSKFVQTFEHENVEKRILHVLVKMVSEFGNTIPLTRREIAEMAGTTVETSIRTFSSLEREGLVSTTRGKITVKSVAELNRHMEINEP